MAVRLLLLPLKALLLVHTGYGLRTNQTFGCTAEAFCGVGGHGAGLETPANQSMAYFSTAGRLGTWTLELPKGISSEPELSRARAQQVEFALSSDGL